eukprot:m51a1_g8299 putative 116 kda u5 small nuclear ribonucleoprotein component-like (1011) ;mRNA; r:34797-38622
MDEDLYDEFGNYLGPQADDDSDASGAEADDDDAADADAGPARAPDATSSPMRDEEEAETAVAPVEVGSRAVVLHEDKKYYPTASEVYGDVETLVEEEDTQALTTPIVEPLRVKKFAITEQELPETTFSPEYLAQLMDTPELVRNVVVAGNLHHGKTSLVDMFVQQTHAKNWNVAKNARYTDTRKDEQDEGLSIKTCPISLVLPDSNGKHFLINFIDTPGHVNFSDEVTAALRLGDGLMLVVDACEGPMHQTERVVRQAVRAGLRVVLVINKVDRLILELKLPPTDAYHKLRHLVEQANALLDAAGADMSTARLSPDAGNVVFASSLHGWSFTLESFARLYTDRADVRAPSALPVTADAQTQAAQASAFSARELARRLWGDLYYHAGPRAFRRQPPPAGAGSGGARSFVEFVLEPLYKAYASVIGDESELALCVASLGVNMKRAERRRDVQPMLRVVLGRWLGQGSCAGGFVDAATRHLPSPVAGARAKAEAAWSGPLGDASSAYAASIAACDAAGPLMVCVAKLITKPDASGFDALGRVMSGVVRAGQRVAVLGETYSPEDEEDRAEADVTRLFVLQARYRVEVTRVPAGSLVLLENVDASIAKTATVVACETPEHPHVFRPLAFDTLSVMKVAVEPLNPSELPKLLDGLRKVNKSYPLAVTKKEESGEHTIVGTGELYLNCIMRDLRELYSDIEIKVSDPVVSFCETVVETSSIKCFAHTPNKKNKLTMIAEPLEQGMAEDIEQHEVRADWDAKRLEAHLQHKYGWDLLAARSFWAFGPDAQGPNALLDDSLPTEVDKKALSTIRSYVVQGFRWGTREGPLCEEPIRGVKFKLLGASLAAEEQQRGGVQIIPTARRVCYSAFLMATPRLMEPVYSVEIQTPQDCIPAIYTVISRRRGQVASEAPCPGTPLHVLKAFVPVIDSFGFETDLRSHTQGQAFCCQVFDHWAVVPGDPCDRSIVLRPLEPSPTQHLAREFMVKTRRRKGLSEDVTPAKFFDEELMMFMNSQSAV